MNVSFEQLRQIRRTNFFAFTIWAFKVLHPATPFKQSWHVMAMCFAMEELARRRRRRQIVAVPPRHLKSITASVALTAWMMGRDPSLKILVASYGADLASKHSRDFRKIVGHPEFQRMFPRFALLRNTNDEIETTLGGVRKAVSPGSATTGFGADVVIIDDLIKVSDARSEAVREAANTYVDESLYTRFNEKADGRLLAVQQRIHERDVVGHLKDKCAWDELILPAFAQERQVIPLYNGQVVVREVGDVLAPDIEDREALEEARSMMGPQAFAGQYLQNPVALGGNRIRWEWFFDFEWEPRRDQLLYVVQSWDTALKEDPTCDYSVCITFGLLDDDWLVLDVLRRRMNYTDLKGAAQALYRRWRPDKVLIEQASTGGALAVDLHRWVPAPERGRIAPHFPTFGKEERVEVYNSRLEEMQIAVPEQAAWLSDFRNELAAFPAGRHDDQVDALFQFLEWMESRRGRAFFNVDPRTGRKRPGTRPHGTDYSRLGR